MTAPDAGFTIGPLRATDVAEARALMLRVVTEDLKDPYDPVIHADVDDLVGTYLGGAGPFLLAAVDDNSGHLVGTAGIRSGRLEAQCAPPDLALRYADGRTGQLVRCYTLGEHRRRGIARALVEAVLRQAAAERHYDRIALHTYRHSPGALAFWLAMGATLVADDTDGSSRAVFLELPRGAPTSHGYGTDSLIPETALIPTNDSAGVAAVVAELGANRVAAISAEPVVGTGGVIPPAEGYLEGLQALACKHDILPSRP